MWKPSLKVCFHRIENGLLLFEVLMITMVDQKKTCCICKRFFRDTVTSGKCPHNFCKKCLWGLSYKKCFSQGLNVPRRCFNCYRPFLHIRKELECPECKTKFRCKESTMPGELYFQMLKKMQLLLSLNAVYFASVWLFNGEWFKTIFCGMLSAFLSICACNIQCIEINYYRFCCVDRKRKVFILIFILTASACALLL